MKQTLTAQTAEISTGHSVPGYILKESGIRPTGIDCFEYSHYLLYQKGNKRYILQPQPLGQYKVIRTYNFVHANYC